MDKKQYHETWDDYIRPTVLKRDKYKCVHCGIKHRSYVLIDSSNKRIVIDRVEHEEYKYQGLRTYRIYLQVAHLDNNKNNNDFENLRTLCNKCHNEYDKNHKKLIRLTNPKK